ncbi:hypothetical protein V6N11_069014 [Hibiscus sabdariffa]|uniref:Uncharacterized protein n=1 Tax=Hibiscus sabdariffa TaxID=183260 RepID=A0ABR1ZXI7_9ROSI
MEKQEKRADRRGNDEEGKQGVISLFVENLPESLHWKGLWFAFARDTQGWKRSTAGRSQSFEPKQTRNGKNVDAVVQKMVAKGSAEEDTGNGKLKRITGHEIGFNDGTSYPLCNKWKKVEKVNEKTEESVSESKSKTENNDKVEVEVNRSWSGMEEEAQEAMWAEKDFINEGNREKETSRGQINFSELMGEVPKVETANGRVDNTENIINGEEKLADQKGGNNVCLAGSGNEEMDGNSDQELNKSAGHEAGPRKNSVSQSGPELSGGEGSNPVDHMGYDYEIDEGSIKQLPEAKKNWADSLNEKLNTGKSWSRLSNGANTSEEELDRDCFAEIEEKKEKRRKKKAKKRQNTWGVVFAGPFSGRENVPISSCAVKTALQILKKAGWTIKSELVAELDIKILIIWLENPL